ncbi:MAG: DNA integrity scanning protein DisA nucleotide-binding domain protein [Planctomycetales bacterium]|nr:DNA integrity scanning protein DisA nucleotide-binding domain protein [Planctomycetales bacterium]
MFNTTLQLAVKLFDLENADAIVLVVDRDVDWSMVTATVGERPTVVSTHDEGILGKAKAHQLGQILIELEDAPVFEKLTQALLEGVAAEALAPSAEVVAVYSGFQAASMDTISYIKLNEHLGKLTARDLRRLETSVPLETLKLVIDLAVEVGREGREGKPVGTMFVVGDTRKVALMSQPAGFDPLKGYKRAERDLRDPRVREAIKEIAQLDGAFLITPEGIAEKSCRIIEARHANITLSAGLGARHWAAAAITKNTNAVCIVVSESNGTVRLFQNGEVLLRIEPLNRRAMKWKDFDYEPPSSNED